jgi:hypothetical protein
MGGRVNVPHFYMVHEPTCSLETTNLLNRTLGGVYAIMEMMLERQIQIFLLSQRTPVVVCSSGGGGLLPASAADKFRPSP